MMIKRLIMKTLYGLGIASMIIMTSKGKVLGAEDIPTLRDKTMEDFGEDFVMGTAITGEDLGDEKFMGLVTEHFNAVTLGNELKPDAMFDYSNYKCPGKQEDELNGETITVPKLSFKRAERILDRILKWNEEHPDKKIRVRGHVLVWHSQTPKWFFCEDYDPGKPFVSASEMNKRMEWYIREVLTHFTGEDSPYRDMIYGWDVVNEAVSDSGAKYRNDTEKSNWWAVYGSNEYIINAFRYANKYAPAEVKLYYNDYNECGAAKMNGIMKLLTDVKEAEGTRIDGMGMQGHYDTSAPTKDMFKMAARSYGKIVGTVMLTELDFKASKNYDGTADTLQAEYMRQAYRYGDIYNAIKELNEEGEISFEGLTVWGVTDGKSWLQHFTGVGGGVTDGRPQCPLLFNDDYLPKPAFWAIVDPNRMKEPIEDREEATEAEETDEIETETVDGTNTEIASADTDNAGIEEDAVNAVNAETSPDASEEKKGGSALIPAIVVVVLLAAFLIFRKSRKK